MRKILLLVAVFLLAVVAVFWGINRVRSDAGKPALPQIDRRADGNAGSNARQSPNVEDLWGAQDRSPAEDSAAVFNDWLSAVAKGDGLKAEQIRARLMVLLRGNPKGNQAVYRRAAQILADRSVESDLKFPLVEILDRAATPSALRVFLDLLNQDLSPDLRRRLIAAVSDTGEYYWDKSSFAEVAPMLLQSWRETRDPQLLQALAVAIAKVGDVNGVNQLVDTVLGQETQSPSYSAAQSALKFVNNPGLIPFIGKRLSRVDAGTAEMAVCADILASMCQVEATRVLFEWAQNADGQYAALVREAFARISDPASVDYLASFVNAARFKSAFVRTAVLTALKKP